MVFVIKTSIDFEDSTDIYWARQQVSERLNAIKDELPANIEGGLAPISTFERNFNVYDRIRFTGSK